MINYRPEIDGLRAIAVIPVVLFHAGISGFSGGFVGVDIFFVISGYLITAKVHHDLTAGRFRLLDFYERRARRIVPLLLTVILACIPLASFLFTPGDFSRFANSIPPALKLTSEIFFRKTGGYFDVIDYPRPLLHTWSLSIEEKYYIVFPIIFGLVFAKWRRSLPLILASSTGFLFVASVALSILKPEASYYMFWARIWEILLGATVALCGTQISTSVPQALKSALVWASIFAIALCVHYYNADIPYPGFYSAIPSIATAILLTCSYQRSLVSRVLSSSPFVFVGLLSYSIYMWHQPTIVFAEEIGWFGSPFQKISVFFLILAISCFSWRLIEKPFRRASVVSTKRFIISTATIVALIFPASHYLKKMGDERISQVAPSNTNDLQLVDECFLLLKPEFSPKCFFPQRSDKLRILVIGDSHASAISPELKQWASDRDAELKSLTAAYCLPLVATFPSNMSETATPRCEQINKKVLKEIQAARPDIIVVAAYMYLWSAAADTKPVDLRWAYPSYFADFRIALTELARHHKVIVFGQVPVWTKGLPDLAAQELGVFGHDLATINQYSNDGLQPGLRSFDLAYREAVESSGAVYVSVLDAVCNANGCPRFELNENGKPELTAVDYGHLSRVGAKAFVSKTLEPILDGTGN